MRALLGLAQAVAGTTLDDLDLVGDDMLRTLTPRGEKQAQRMGAWLDRQLPAGTKVLVSPALRAAMAAVSPAAPVPTTSRSHCSVAVVIGVKRYRRTLD